MKNMLNYIPFPSSSKNRFSLLWESIYLICVVIMLFCCWNTVINRDFSAFFHLFNRVVRLAITALMLLKLYFFSNLNIKFDIILTVILFFFAVSMIKTRQIVIFCMLALTLAAKDVAYEKIAKTFFYFFFITLGVTVSLCLIGLLGDLTTQKEYIVRHSLGFQHSNTLGVWCMMTVVSFLQGYQKNLRIIHFLFLLAFTLIFYFFSDSRTSLVCSMVALVLSYVAVRFQKKTIAGNRFAIFTAIVVVSIVLFFEICTIFYTPKSHLFRILSTFFTGRIALSHSAILQSGFSLFGQIHIGEIVPVDSFLTEFPIYSGIIPSLLYLALILCCIFRAGKYNNLQILVLFFVFTLYSITEALAVNNFNLPLFALTSVLPSASPISSRGKTDEARLSDLSS